MHCNIFQAMAFFFGVNKEVLPLKINLAFQVREKLTKSTKEQQAHKCEARSFDNPWQWTDVHNQVVDNIQLHSPYGREYALRGDSGNCEADGYV